MIIQKNTFLILFILVFNFCNLSSMQESLQEQLNNDQLKTFADNPQRSHYLLGLAITSELMNTQLTSFHERMRSQGIIAGFSRNTHSDTLITFFARLPHTNRLIKLHQIFMPFNENPQLNQAGTRAQLRRRFENRIENFIEQLRDTLEKKARDKYNASWAKKFYFKIAPRVIDQVSDKIAADLAKDLIHLMPFSLKETLNPSIENIKDLENIITEFKEKHAELNDIENLTGAMEEVQRLLDNLPPEQKEEKDAIQAQTHEKFCDLFEQLVTA